MLEVKSPAAPASADRALELLRSAASNSKITASGSHDQGSRGGAASPEAVAEIDEFLLDEIHHDLHLIRSYSTSAIEAAVRGDRDELRLRLRVQLRDVFRHAIELHNLLSPKGAQGGGA
jgi:hypothetical protein